jgi:hypothetical protein
MAFLGGPEAAARVAADPFWSVVRRRHPDVELVLLPPAVAPDEAVSDAPATAVGVEDATAECLARVAGLWQQVVGDVVPDEQRAGWTTGPTPDLMRHEATWTLLAVDPVTATGAIDRAADTLRDEGWRVLAPPDGMPRVLAGRPAQSSREELDLVLVPSTGRFFLTVRSGLYRLEDLR